MHTVSFKMRLYIHISWICLCSKYPCMWSKIRDTVFGNYDPKLWRTVDIREASSLNMSLDFSLQLWLSQYKPETLFTLCCAPTHCFTSFKMLYLNKTNFMLIFIIKCSFFVYFHVKHSVQFFHVKHFELHFLYKRCYSN